MAESLRKTPPLSLPTAPRLVLLPYLPLREARDSSLHASLVAGAAMCALLALARQLDLSTIALERFLGDLAVGAETPGAGFLGLLLTLVLCVAAGSRYPRLFRRLSSPQARPGLRSGLAFGFVAFVFGGIPFALAGAFVPSLGNIMSWLAGTLVFGALVGALYRKHERKVAHAP
jgi:hypothetical protein